MIRTTKSILKKSKSFWLSFVYNKLISLGLEEPKPRISVFPFISGDLFLAAADVAIIHNLTYPIILRSNMNILFVEADLLEKPNIFEYACKFKAVIAHNGDHVLTNKTIELMADFGIKVFATNVQTNAHNVYTLPIGIENAHHRRNGTIHYFNPLHLSALWIKKERHILVSFSTSTNPTVRCPLEDKFLQSGFVNQKMCLSEYRSKLAASRFVISPPGNGVDCHRTWEAFYHKTVPVVQRRYWYFEEHDLPVLVVDEFDDFINMTERQKQDLYHDIIENKYYDAIYFDYWLDYIKEKICAPK